eukprot:2492624-Prymnesium_polylepis.1
MEQYVSLHVCGPYCCAMCKHQFFRLNAYIDYARPAATRHIALWARKRKRGVARHGAHGRCLLSVAAWDLSPQALGVSSRAAASHYCAGTGTHSTESSSDPALHARQRSCLPARPCRLEIFVGFASFTACLVAVDKLYLFYATIFYKSAAILDYDNWEPTLRYPMRWKRGVKPPKMRNCPRRRCGVRARGAPCMPTGGTAPQPDAAAALPLPRPSQLQLLAAVRRRSVARAAAAPSSATL